jgi:hypothetical protein
MITSQNHGGYFVFYDDTIDLNAYITPPERTWNGMRTFYNDQRANVRFQSRVFTAPETERLAKFLETVGNFANELNATFDRENRCENDT